MASVPVLGSLALLLSASQDAGAKPDADASPALRTVTTLPQRPDCQNAYNCLCPWKDVLGPKDFTVLNVDDIPDKVVHCHRQSYCEWRVYHGDNGVSIYHGAPRRDAIPVFWEKIACSTAMGLRLAGKPIRC